MDHSNVDTVAILDAGSQYGKVIGTTSSQIWLKIILI